MDKYVTVKKAAEHFKKHHRTVDNWIKAGFFPLYEGETGDFVRLDEIERAFEKYPTKMRRGGSDRFGPHADVRLLPEDAEIG